MTDATTTVAGEYLWAIRYALLAIAAYCLLKAGISTYKAFVLWRYRNAPSHPEIAEALKSSRSDVRYHVVMAALWLLCTGLAICNAFVAIA